MWGRHGRRRARSVGTRFRSTGRCDAHQSGWRAPEHSSFRAQAPQMPVSLQRARLPHCRSLTRTACLRPVPPSVSADLRSALIQGGGRKRYARALAGCHDLGFELGAIAPASTPAKRHFYFDGMHVSTCFDKRMRYSAIQDGMPGRLYFGNSRPIYGLHQKVRQQNSVAVFRRLAGDSWQLTGTARSDASQ